MIVKTISHSSFKTTLSSLCKSDDIFMVINYLRPILGQTGSGHFSPIGGVSIKDNKVLIMETAKFKYPFFWCDFDDLYDSMFEIDKDNNRQRGLLIMSKNQIRQSKLKGCDLLTKKKLEENFWQDFGDWFQENKNYLEIFYKQENGNVYEFFNYLPESFVDLWLRF